MRRGVAGRRILFGTATLVGLVAQALAQQAASPTPEAKTVIVTGYRASVESSTRDKREATGFQDSVFAEDIGKFPDTNIAESLNRIPGVLISREITGEGLNIQIRGLGTSFTKILLNGAPVAVASTGRTDNQNTNREVDLDMLPTELFTQALGVQEPDGGDDRRRRRGRRRHAHRASLRQSRPATSRCPSPASRTPSPTSGATRARSSPARPGAATFGILGGFAWGKNKIRTTGFETIGWTNPNLSATQSTSATRNNTGGGNWTIPGHRSRRTPATASPRAPSIDQAFLLAHNPGRTITQIDNAHHPAPRPHHGRERARRTATAAWSASSGARAATCTSTSTRSTRKKKNDMKRVDMNWVGRNGAMIPLNMTGRSRRLRQRLRGARTATFANAQFFLEYRPYIGRT